MDVYYNTIIKPFLAWVQHYQIQTFVDILGDIGWVCLVPIIFVCAIKYLVKGE